MGDSYRYKPLSYFALAFVLSWVPWSFAARYSYQGAMDLYSNLFALLGLLGPFFAALIMIRRSGSRDLKHDFKERLVNLRLIRAGYIPVILLLMPFALLLSTWVSVGVGRSAAQFRFSGGLVTMLPIILLAPIFEEPDGEATEWTACEQNSA